MFRCIYSLPLHTCIVAIIVMEKYYRRYGLFYLKIDIGILFPYELYFSKGTTFKFIF